MEAAEAARCRFCSRLAQIFPLLLDHALASVAGVARHLFLFLLL
jgi:hypothetical protein